VSARAERGPIGRVPFGSDICMCADVSMLGPARPKAETGTLTLGVRVLEAAAVGLLGRLTSDRLMAYPMRGEIARDVGGGLYV